MSNLLTEDKVADRLNVSLASIRRWRLERRGPRYIKVGSLVRYRPEDVESWLAGLPTGGSATEPDRSKPVGRQMDRPAAQQAS